MPLAKGSPAMPTTIETHDMRTMIVNGQPLLAAIPHFSTLDLLVADAHVMNRLKAKIEIPEDRMACHLWTGAVHKDGYGGLWTRSGMIRAHRLLYRSVAGRVPEFAFKDGQRKSVVIGHTCHDVDLQCSGGVADPHRLCMNERHLALQTQSHNVLVGRRWAKPHLELAS